MKITLAENLRKLRRDRNLTQEDIADFLGVSFQAVSKWERDEGFPDISMLPVIANFFGITVDALIGNDISSRDERIKAYCDEYWHCNKKGDMDAAADIAKKAYRDYPYDWNIIDIYCLSLTKGYSEYPGGKLSELRDICRMIMDKCTDAKIRMHAVYSMLFAEDDEHVEEWFAEVPGTYDFTEWERREERYLERNQIEKYRHQKQLNMMQLYNYLLGKLNTCAAAPQDALQAYQRGAHLIEALFGGENIICQSFNYSFILLSLSSALFECGRKEDGYKALENAVNCCVEWFSIPEGTELHYVGLFDTLSVKRGNTLDKVSDFLNGIKQKSGFKLVDKEERFIKLTDKIRNCMPK